MVVGRQGEGNEMGSGCIVRLKIVFPSRRGRFLVYLWGEGDSASLGLPAQRPHAFARTGAAGAAMDVSSGDAAADMMESKLYQGGFFDLFVRARVAACDESRGGGAVRGRVPRHGMAVRGKHRKGRSRCQETRGCPLLQG